MSTYRPFEQIERPVRSMFAGLSSGPPGTVVVVDREGHHLKVLRGPEDRLTAGEARFGRIRTLYLVDVGEHALAFQEAFPCRGANGSFLVRVHMNCVVLDPEAVVRRQIQDVTALLRPAISRVIRQVCQRFEAEQQAEAERTAHAATLKAVHEDGIDPAFRVEALHLELALDAAAERFLLQLKENNRSRQLQGSSAALETERLQVEADLARQRRQVELESGRHEAVLQGEQQEAEIQRLRLRANAERETERAQVEHYLEVLRSGGDGLVALEMVRDQPAVKAIIERLARERHDLGKQKLEALGLLLEHDALEAWKAQDEAARVLKQLMSLFEDGPSVEHRPSVGPVTVAQELTARGSAEVVDVAAVEPLALDDEDFR